MIFLTNLKGYLVYFELKMDILKIILSEYQFYFRLVEGLSLPLDEIDEAF